MSDDFVRGNVQCVAVTKKGRRCSIESVDFSIYCHVHEPTLQCGATRKDGTRCGVVTGGVRCRYHKNKRKYPDFDLA